MIVGRDDDELRRCVDHAELRLATSQVRNLTHRTTVPLWIYWKFNQLSITSPCHTVPLLQRHLFLVGRLSSLAAARCSVPSTLRQPSKRRSVSDSLRSPCSLALSDSRESVRLADAIPFFSWFIASKNQYFRKLVTIVVPGKRQGDVLI